MSKPRPFAFHVREEIATFLAGRLYHGAACDGVVTMIDEQGRKYETSPAGFANLIAKGVLMASVPDVAVALDVQAVAPENWSAETQNYSAADKVAEELVNDPHCWD